MLDLIFPAAAVIGAMSATRWGHFLWQLVKHRHGG